MKYLIVTFMVISIGISACATHMQTISDSTRQQMIPIVLEDSRCGAIDKMYTDLNTAPANVVAGLPPNISEVWTLKGCPDDKKFRAELFIPKHDTAAVTYSEY